MLVGVLGGPVGMLAGFGTGALLGGALDVERATESDAVMAGLGVVLRRPAADVTDRAGRVRARRPQRGVAEQRAGRRGDEHGQQPDDGAVGHRRRRSGSHGSGGDDGQQRPDGHREEDHAVGHVVGARRGHRPAPAEERGTTHRTTPRS
jgi:hypothetical protein